MNSFRSLRSSLLQAAAIAVVVLSPVSVPACSICGCSLSADWAFHNFSDASGISAGVRFEHIGQHNLRSGTGSVDTAAIAFPNADEIQLSTISRNTWLDLDWTGQGGWGVSLQAPFINRSHATIVDGDTAASTSHANGVGDVRLVARRQLQASHMNTWAFTFGLKLPTGRTDQSFDSGPQAGTPLDRGLQLGTGTTDLLAGAAYFSRPAVEWGWFAQIQLVQPLNSCDGFRPSPSVTASTGVRRLTSGWLTPQLQLNVRWDGREAGANSDTPNSGGTFVALSPGVTAEMGATATAFTSVQVPVWQRVNGLQLEPRWLLTTGVRWRF